MSAGPDLILPPRTASASVKPCEWYTVGGHGSSPPVRTQGHHDHPQYLQRRLWGEVRIHTLRWSCGTCHDSIHAWIDWLLAEAYRPPVPPYRLRAEAERVADWYLTLAAA